MPAWYHPGQLSLLAPPDEGIELLDWACRLPAGRNFIYLKNAQPGQFSPAEALDKFGWDQAQWRHVQHDLYAANLLKEISWGVYEVTDLARAQHGLPFFNVHAKLRPSPLAAV
jgi:hypothetical protein